MITVSSLCEIVDPKLISEIVFSFELRQRFVIQIFENTNLNLFKPFRSWSARKIFECVVQQRILPNKIQNPSRTPTPTPNHFSSSQYCHCQQNHVAFKLERMLLPPMHS